MRKPLPLPFYHPLQIHRLSRLMEASSSGNRNHDRELLLRVNLQHGRGAYVIQLGLFGIRIPTRRWLCLDGSVTLCLFAISPAAYAATKVPNRAAILFEAVSRRALLVCFTVPVGFADQAQSSTYEERPETVFNSAPVISRSMDRDSHRRRSYGSVMTRFRPHVLHGLSVDRISEVWREAEIHFSNRRGKHWAIQ